MTMQKDNWVIFVWPGLPQIWTRGSWSGLAVAVLATVWLIAVMAGSFGWSELIAPGIRNGLWISLAAMWLGAAIISAVKMQYQTAAQTAESCDNPFGRANDLYLRGDYYQAERLLKKLLDRNGRDLEARLMLATLLRHTGRIDEAADQLDRLRLFDGAEKWELEIYRERELLAEAETKWKDKNQNITASEDEITSINMARAA